MNVKIPGDEYERNDGPPNSRGVTSYHLFLDPYLTTLIARLRTGDVLVDFGAGQAVAARQWAELGRFDVIAVNAQDLSGGVEVISHFRYVTGMAEDVMDTLPDGLGGIIDQWGAGFYSADRLGLFIKYHNKLKVGRSAIIVLADDEWRNRDVILHQGRWISIYEFLAENYPSSFSIVQSVSRYDLLLIEKRFSGKIDLAVKADHSGVEYNDPGTKRSAPWGTRYVPVAAP